MERQRGRATPRRRGQATRQDHTGAVQGPTRAQPEGRAMPDEEVREEEGSTSMQPEQRQGEAARDGAVGEAGSLTGSEQPEETSPFPAATSAEGGRNAMPTVSSRKEQFLIAKKSVPLPQDVQPVDLTGLEQALKAGEIAGATHVRTLTRRGRAAMGALSGGAAGAEIIVVAEMPPQVADQLRQHPGLLVEPDHPLVDAQPILPVPVGRDPGVVVPYGTGFTVSLIVLGDGGTPLQGAEVYLYGRWWPVQGVTDARGRVQLTLFGESPHTMRGLVCEAQSRLLESVDHPASARPGTGKYRLSDSSDADVRQLSTAAVPRVGAKSHESGPIA